MRYFVGALLCSFAFGKVHNFMVGAEIGVDQPCCVNHASVITHPRVRGANNKDKISYNKSGLMLGANFEYGYLFREKVYVGVNAALVKSFAKVQGEYFFKFNQKTKYIPKYTHHLCLHAGYMLPSCLLYGKAGVSWLKRQTISSYMLGPKEVMQQKNNCVRGYVFGGGVRFPVIANLYTSIEIKHSRYKKETLKFNEGISVTQRFKSNTLSLITSYAF